MDDFAIKVSGLSKKYSISNNLSHLKLSEKIINKLLFWRNTKHKFDNDFYALKDINFEIKKGETVGIIGSNGAGKSTLLKILSEVTEPSEGKIEINGKIASVLEVGMGFHPELTGRENIYLSGAMLGLSKWFIQEKFNEIVEFSEIDKFIDTPVKHYSSGMYVRLAFSVASNIDADILLFDEILNVGDIAFRIKSEEKLLSLIAKKKTILIVSHNSSEIYKLCEKVMYLEKGKLHSFGDKNVISNYLNKAYKNEGFTDNKNINRKYFDINKIVEENDHKILKIISFSINAKENSSIDLDPFRDYIQIEAVMEVFSDQNLEFGFIIKQYENYLLETGTAYSNSYFDLAKYKNFRITLHFDLPNGILFASGTYVFTTYITNSGRDVLYSNDFLFNITKEIANSDFIDKNASYTCAIKALSKINVIINSELIYDNQ